MRNMKVSVILKERRRNNEYLSDDDSEDNNGDGLVVEYEGKFEGAFIFFLQRSWF